MSIYHHFTLKIIVVHSNITMNGINQNILPFLRSKVNHMLSLWYVCFNTDLYTQNGINNATRSHGGNNHVLSFQGLMCLCDICMVYAELTHSLNNLSSVTFSAHSMNA
jgi:hypothetical protein